jgi:hypothetical protein
MMCNNLSYSDKLRSPRCPSDDACLRNIGIDRPARPLPADAVRVHDDRESPHSDRMAAMWDLALKERNPFEREWTGEARQASGSVGPRSQQEINHNRLLWLPMYESERTRFLGLSDDAQTVLIAAARDVKVYVERMTAHHIEIIV